MTTRKRRGSISPGSPAEDIGMVWLVSSEKHEANVRAASAGDAIRVFCAIARIRASAQADHVQVIEVRLVAREVFALPEDAGSDGNGSQG